MCLCANSVIDEINGRINRRLRSSTEPSRLRIARCLYGLEGSNTVPFPQRRSWWRTPTAALSRSASPWCLCRSQCHLASICSTSPGGDKEECFFFFFFFDFEGLVSQQLHGTQSYISSNICMDVLHWSCRTPFLFFVPYCRTSLPPTWYSCIKTISFESKKKKEEICLIACSTRHRGSAANGNPAYRWKSSFSHHCFFIRTSIMWKWA